jgi:pimeloyl-ACP methyl ester carboxylesterase
VTLRLNGPSAGRVLRLLGSGRDVPAYAIGGDRKVVGSQRCSASPVRRGQTARAGYPPARTHMVTTDDGVTLTVREVGGPEATVTAVFCHGLCLDMSSWRCQRAGLRRMWGDEIRLVFYDHRGHGESADGHPDEYTINRLGSDLATVLDAVAATGPIILVGHSMGGMAILAYLGANADAIGTRVIGVGLIATAADRIADTGLGRALNTPIVEVLKIASHGPEWLFEGGWHVVRRLATPLLGRGDKPSRVRPGTVVSFLSAIRHYDESRTLALLSTIPTLVVCGTDDPLTPITHSARLAATLPDAELVAVAGAKHEVAAEHPDTVCSAIARLLTRALSSQPTTSRLGAGA